MKKGCLRLFSMVFCLALALGCLVSLAGAESNAVIETGLFSGAKLVPYQIPSLYGFTVPKPEGEFWAYEYDRWTYIPFTSGKQNENGCYYVLLDYYMYPIMYPMEKTFFDRICEEPRKQKDIMMNNVLLFFRTEPGFQDMAFEYVEHDGHPIVLVIYNDSKILIDDEGTSLSVGAITYIRNSTRLLIRVLSYLKDTPVTMDDLKQLASVIEYDESMAPLTAADAALTVSAEGDPVTVSAGKSVKFRYDFANPERVNRKNRNDAVTWTVWNAKNYANVNGVSIDGNGRLSVDKSLAAPVELQVTVASSMLDSSATYNITAVPLARKVNLDPAELFFYTGSEEAQTVKASLEPVGLPNTGLTWTPVKKDLVEITEVEDGAVSIRPLKAGKTDIAVKEPGGKNAKLKVNVVEPVESVELKANGKVRAGGKVKIAATLLPKNAGNKTVQWSVDVGENIAKIDSKGQLKIAKGVPSGTKISVTCTAVGAPEPVSATLEIEIP